MKITVETIVNAPLQQVWDAHNNPADIRQWNAASDDWHTTESTVDLREGGTFRSRMEARDGSGGFDFSGTYTRVVPPPTSDSGSQHRTPGRPPRAPSTCGKAGPSVLAWRPGTAAPASISPARIPGSFPRRQLRTAWMTVAK